MTGVQLGRALYDFTGDATLRQLTFKKDDMIKVTNQFPNGWWAGELHGKVGYLPSTYVRLEGPAPHERSGTLPTKQPAPVPPRSISGNAIPAKSVPPTPQGRSTLPNGSGDVPPRSHSGTTPVRPNPQSPKPPPPVSRPPPSNPQSRPPQQQPPQQHKPASPRPPPIQGRPPAKAPTKTDVNETDLAELDSLLKALQNEIADLKKYM